MVIWELTIVELKRGGVGALVDIKTYNGGENIVLNISGLDRVSNNVVRTLKIGDELEAWIDNACCLKRNSKSVWQLDKGDVRLRSYEQSVKRIEIYKIILALKILKILGGQIFTYTLF